MEGKREDSYSVIAWDSVCGVALVPLSDSRGSYNTSISRTAPNSCVAVPDIMGPRLDVPCSFGGGKVIGELDLETLFEGGCRLFSSLESLRGLLRDSIAICSGFAGEL